MKNYIKTIEKQKDFLNDTLMDYCWSFINAVNNGEMSDSEIEYKYYKDKDNIIISAYIEYTYTDAEKAEKYGKTRMFVSTKKINETFKKYIPDWSDKNVYVYRGDEYTYMWKYKGCGPFEYRTSFEELDKNIIENSDNTEINLYMACI